MKTVTGKRRALHGLMAAIVSTMVLVMSVATSAQASGASGGSNYYDGRNPATTKNSAGVYCNANASHIATRPILDRDTGKHVASI